MCINMIGVYRGDFNTRFTPAKAEAVMKAEGGASCGERPGSSERGDVEKKIRGIGQPLCVNI
jgi:hypothetical protein